MPSKLQRNSRDSFPDIRLVSCIVSEFLELDAEYGHVLLLLGHIPHFDDIEYFVSPIIDSVIHSKSLLIGLESVVMLPKHMYDELLGGLVHRLGQPSQLSDFDDSLHLCLRLD